MNRIKEVLEEKGIKQTWLAEKLGKSYNMVNSYVQNRQQPRLEVLNEIAIILDVDVRELLSSTKTVSARFFLKLPSESKSNCTLDPSEIPFLFDRPPAGPPGDLDRPTSGEPTLDNFSGGSSPDLPPDFRRTPGRFPVFPVPANSSSEGFFLKGEGMLTD